MFVWDDKCEQVFIILKNAFTAQSISSYLNLDQKTVIKTYTSNFVFEEIFV